MLRTRPPSRSRVQWQSPGLRSVGLPPAQHSSGPPVAVAGLRRPRDQSKENYRGVQSEKGRNYHFLPRTTLQFTKTGKSRCGGRTGLRPQRMAHEPTPTYVLALGRTTVSVPGGFPSGATVWLSEAVYVRFRVHPVDESPDRRPGSARRYRPANEVCEWSQVRLPLGDDVLDQTLQTAVQVREPGTLGAVLSGEGRYLGSSGRGVWRLTEEGSGPTP